MSLFDGGRRARKKRIAAYLEYRQAKRQFENDDEYDEDDYDYDYEIRESEKSSKSRMEDRYDEEADYEADEQYDEDAEYTDNEIDDSENENYSEEYPDDDLNDYPDEYAEESDEEICDSEENEEPQYEENTGHEDYLYQTTSFEEFDEDEHNSSAEDYVTQEDYVTEEDYDDYNDFDDFNPSKAVIITFIDKVRNLETIEKMSIALAVVIIASGIFAFSLYSNVKAQQDEINSFAEIGTEAENIEEIGQTGLDAMASAKSSENAATEASSLAEAIELSTGSVDVNMTLSTIVSDLKIKFTNADTGKLIASVPFKVSVKDKSGNVTEYENDDMDGIIYETNVKAGEYTVSLETLDDEKYAAYNFDSDAQTITVKDTAEYKVVDVSDEVKSEAEVDVAAEDTQVKEAVESENTDTVDWVESTTTATANTESSSDTTTSTTSTETYIEISKDEIVVPSDSASLGINMHKLVEEDDVVEDTEYEGSDDYFDGDDDSDESSDSSDDTSDSTSDSESESTSDSSVTMSISASTATIEIGKTATLSATASNGSTDITWYSDDELIATVDENGVVTAVSPGTVEITAELTSDDSIYASCNVTVISDAAASTGSLCDSGGNPVYVQESDGTYRIATVDDYDKYDKFYVRSSSSVAGSQTYTGWQTIGGKTYYYDKDGNPVTGSQVIQGVQYNFDSSGALITGSGTLGIDVSRWNGTIDWSAVKNSGVNYAIIRCGYRGSSSGALIEDSLFRTNIQGAVNAGIKVGVYFYTQATTEAEAIEEASFVVSMIKNYGLSYPVYLDVEKSNGRGDAISYDMRTTVCKAFCKTITNSGYSAGIYASKTWFESKFDVSALTSYKIWLAQYATSATYSKSRYDMWQYTAKGSVSGISGDVDMNLSY